jgi:hypothetical protein
MRKGGSNSSKRHAKLNHLVKEERMVQEEAVVKPEPPICIETDYYKSVTFQV